MDVLILAIHIGERGELISTLHPYDIRVSLAHRNIKKLVWPEGHIIHLRGRVNFIGVKGFS
jgi:hypothetical protein